MEGIKIRECKNGRFGLNLDELNRGVSNAIHAYTHDGYVEIEVINACMKLIDGFNWKTESYYNTKEEAQEVAEKALTIATETAKASKVKIFQDRLAKHIKDLEIYREEGNERMIEKTVRNIGLAKKHLAELM